MVNVEIENIMKTLDNKNKENKMRVKKLCRLIEMLSIGTYNEIEYHDDLLIFRNKNKKIASCINIDGLYFNRDMLI